MSARRWLVFYKHLTQIVFQFLPTVSILLTVYHMFNYATSTPAVVPPVNTFSRSLFYRVLCMSISFVWYLFLLCASMALGFCRLHREQITYLYISSACVWIHRWWNMGAITKYLVWLSFAVGVLILCVVAYRLVLKPLIQRLHGRHHKEVLGGC